MCSNELFIEILPNGDLMIISAILHVIFFLALIFISCFLVIFSRSYVFNSPYLLDILHVSSVLLLVLGVSLLIASIYVLFRRCNSFHVAVSGYGIVNMTTYGARESYNQQLYESSVKLVRYFSFSKMFAFFTCVFCGSLLAIIALKILINTLPQSGSMYIGSLKSHTGMPSDGLGLISLILTALAVVMAFVTSGVVTTSKNAVNEVKNATSNMNRMKSQINDVVVKTKLQHSIFIVDKQRVFIGLQSFRFVMYENIGTNKSAIKDIVKYYDFFYGYLAFDPLSIRLLEMHLGKIDKHKDIWLIEKKYSEDELIENIISLLDVMIEFKLDFDEKNIDQAYLQKLLAIRIKYYDVKVELDNLHKKTCADVKALENAKNTLFSWSNLSKIFALKK